MSQVSNDQINRFPAFDGLYDRIKGIMRILIMLKEYFLVMFSQTHSQPGVKKFVVIEMNNAHFPRDDHGY